MPLYQQGGKTSKMPDLSGLGQGLSNAVQMYYQQKQLKQQQERQKQLADRETLFGILDLISKGAISPETAQSPQYQSMQKGSGLPPMNVMPQPQPLDISTALSSLGENANRADIEVSPTGKFGGAKISPPATETGSNMLARMKANAFGSMTPEEQKKSMMPASLSQSVNVDTKPAPQGEREGIVKLENIKAQALRAKDLWNEKYTGWEAITAPYREKLTGLMTPEESKFRQNMQSLVKKMYADSGKQLSDKEWEKLSGTLPRMNVADDVFPPQLDEWINTIDNELSMSRSSLTESGYIAPSGKVSSAPVMMVSPDGQEYIVPADKVKEATDTYKWKVKNGK